MSVFDGKRLSVGTFKLDVERMRRGWYSDKYFLNIVSVLAELAQQGYRFGGSAPDLSDIGVDVSNVSIGDIEVEMQWFTRRKPFAVVVGVDKSLAMLQTCTGSFDPSGDWVDTYEQAEVVAVHDGAIVSYAGDTRKVLPVLKVRGRYRDFAALETPTLGALTRGSRIATNVLHVLDAANGKDVLFFPARFDAHEVQAADGYAYHIAVQASNRRTGRSAVSLVSTDEQGDWWGGGGGGTVAHAAIACFLGDTPETMMASPRFCPRPCRRIALVDSTTIVWEPHSPVMGENVQPIHDADGSRTNRRSPQISSVRGAPDTGANMRDVSIAPLGDPKLTTESTRACVLPCGRRLIRHFRRGTCQRNGWTRHAIGAKR